jgi:NAD(P)-dependent dehydrogenase (short-subunit alcohol dehydrogenase family)
MVSFFKRGRKRRKGRDCRHRCGERPCDLEFIHGDVTDSKFVAKIAADVKERYGQIDVAFNNAGIAHSVPAESSSDEEWHMIINTNLHAATS